MRKSIDYTEDFVVKSFEVNACNVIKPHSFFHYMEDIAYKHAEKYGFGYSATYPNGYGWFLLKCHIKFDTVFHAWSKLTISTWPCESRGIQCRRDFLVTDEDNDVVATAATSWGLINFETKRLVNPFKVLNFPQLYPEYSMVTNFDKIPELEKISYSKKFEVRFEDVDLNNHVNNAIYISWAIEALPYEFLKKYVLSEVEIYFKKEATFGTDIVSEVFWDVDKNTTIHAIKNSATNDELTSLRLMWK